MHKVKLIWDFRGPNAHKIAEHHESHLKEFIRAEQLTPKLTGFQKISEFQAAAFMVVDESEVQALRNTLKPHRGEIFN